jgi:sugar lactone lactonase YvrE
MGSLLSKIQRRSSKSAETKDAKPAVAPAPSAAAAATTTTTQLQTWKAEKPYLNLHCALGEGPWYEKATNSLRFLDIINKKIYTVSLDKGPESLTTITLDSPVGVTCDIEGVDPQEKILVGLKYGLAVLDRKTSKYEYISKFNETDNERLRGNDGAADPQGRFWIGAMTDFGLGDCQPEGECDILPSHLRAMPRTIVKLRGGCAIGGIDDRCRAKGEGQKAKKGVLRMFACRER